MVVILMLTSCDLVQVYTVLSSPSKSITLTEQPTEISLAQLEDGTFCKGLG